MIDSMIHHTETRREGIMSRRPSPRSRHYVVERESTPMHEDQFRAPDRRDDDEEEDDEDDDDEDGLIRAMG